MKARMLPVLFAGGVILAAWLRKRQRRKRIARGKAFVKIVKLQQSDRADWERLWRGYMTFYERPDLQQKYYDDAWMKFQQDTRVHALGAKVEGKLVGLVHFLEHANTWGPDMCYLQDLFTDPALRGRGVGRALIAAVEEWA